MPLQKVYSNKYKIKRQPEHINKTTFIYMRNLRAICIVSLSVLFLGCIKKKETLAPVASFEISQLKPVVDENILFSNTSKNATSYLWDFGDGYTSVDANPYHAFASVGVYSVKLVATGEGGKKTFLKDISVVSKPVAGFSTKNTTATINHKIKFKNTSENATSFFWDFGDGTTSIEESPTHFYSLKGVYTVTLTATGDGGVETFTKDYTIKAAAPVVVKRVEPVYPLVADFSVDKKEASVNEEVSFLNISQSAKKYFWDFGDGTTSTEETPVHAYQEAGKYLIELRAERFKERKFASDSITIKSVVNFQTSKDSAYVAEPVVFTPIENEGEEPYSVYSWNFGDENTSLAKAPTHSYTEAGEYEVLLTESREATDSTDAVMVKGSKTIKIIEGINPNPVVAKTDDTDGFKVSKSTVVAGEKVEFSSLSKDAKKFLWDFGNGDKAKKKVVSYTFPNIGTFNVSLTEEGKTKDSKKRHTKSIVVTEPPAFFEVSKNSVKPGEDVVFTRKNSQYGQKISWSFGDGKSSKDEKPKHNYKKTGNYIVFLKEKGSSGKRISAKTIFVETNPLDFEMDKTTAEADETISFKIKSNYGQTFSWDFGDTTLATTKDAKHSYAEPGTYTILLKVKDMVGEKTITKTITITESLGGSTDNLTDDPGAPPVEDNTNIEEETPTEVVL